MKKLDLEYPSPSYSQIELDLKRTFFELGASKVELLIVKLRNVLMTYSKRNPTIGYCQGMNFLVGRLLMVIQKSPQDKHLKNELHAVDKDEYAELRNS